MKTKCEVCGGTGSIAYNPNLNPNAFPEIASAECRQCGGSGTICGGERQARIIEASRLVDSASELLRQAQTGCSWSEPLLGVLLNQIAGDVRCVSQRLNELAVILKEDHE
jgi:hypothetical protein